MDLRMASRRGTAGRERRRLGGIGKCRERRVGVGVSVTYRVRQPTPLAVSRNGWSARRTTNRRAAPRVLPPQTRAEQLVPPLHEDLGQQLALRQLAGERRQARLRIVEPAAAGAI